MNLHKLRERQARINRLEFPLKCEEHSIKLKYDKKIQKLKTEINSINSKLAEEYKITSITKDNLNDYVFHIFSLFFNKRNHPIEKEIILQSRQIIDAIQNYQEIKNELVLKEKEKMEDQTQILMEKENKRENDMIKEGFKKIDFCIKNFNKIKDDFFDKNKNKESVRDLSNKFAKLIDENQKLKWDFKFVKIIYEKMMKMYNKEMNNYIKLLRLYNNNKSNENNNKLFATRLISNGNCYDIFNSDYTQKENTKNQNLKLTIKTTTYSTSNTINADKKCLSQENLNQNKNKKPNLFFKNKNKYRNKYFSKKKFLTIKTDNNSLKPKQLLKRIFSANSLTNKNIFNSINKNEEIYLKKIIDFMQQKNAEKNKIIRKIRLNISDEIKMSIWVKNFISKLINEIRNDIDDIKYYLTNDANNEDLNKELNKNEKILFFCVYFYDNCIKGSNNTKYFFDNIQNKTINKNKKNFKES